MSSPTNQGSGSASDTSRGRGYGTPRGHGTGTPRVDGSGGAPGSPTANTPTGTQAAPIARAALITAQTGAGATGGAQTNPNPVQPQGPTQVTISGPLPPGVTVHEGMAHAGRRHPAYQYMVGSSAFAGGPVIQYSCQWCASQSYTPYCNNLACPGDNAVGGFGTGAMTASEALSGVPDDEWLPHSPSGTQGGIQGNSGAESGQGGGSGAMGNHYGSRVH